MITSPSTTRLFGAAMIVFLIMTASYVLQPAPSRVAAPNTATQGATGPAPASAGLLLVGQSDVTSASTNPAAPDRSTGCTLCNSHPTEDAIVVQLDAAPLAGGAILATDVFSPAKTDAARTIAQLQPDPLERPPAA